MIESKFDEANLKEFLLLRYDYNALTSYNKVQGGKQRCQEQVHAYL